MSEEKEYVVVARLANDEDVQSSVNAINLQEATKLAVKLLVPRAGYRAVSVVEVREATNA